MAADGSTAAQIAAALPWTRHERRWQDLDDFNAGLAALETRAHLELLVLRSVLTRSHVDGVAVYRRADPSRPTPIKHSEEHRGASLRR